MAYWIERVGNSNNPLHRGYYADYLSDIEKLPTSYTTGVLQEDTTSSGYCAAGSTCLCLENGSQWILSKDTNEWKQIKNTGDSSTGDDSEDDGTINPDDYIEPIPTDDILDLFD